MKSARERRGAEMEPLDAHSTPCPRANANEPTIRNLMNENVVIAAPNDNVFSATQSMSKYDASCVVVCEGAQLRGFLTESDMLKGVAHDGADLGRIKVSQRMTSPVVVAPPDISVLEAAEIMEAKGIKHLPVVDGERLIGILTQTDVERGLISLSPLKCVSDIMRRDVTTVKIDAPVAKATELMSRRHTSCVVALHRQAAIGIFTEKDLLKRVVALRKDTHKTKVCDVMSFPVASIRPDYSVVSASRKMAGVPFHRFVVMNGETICGLVSQDDIVGALRNEVQARRRSAGCFCRN